MRDDHPVCVAAAPTVNSTAATLPQPCQGRAGRARLRLARPLAAVVVLEPDDVVELRRRDLEDPRVVERLHPMDRAGRKVEGLAGPDHLFLEDALSCLAELEPRTPL